MEYGIQIASFIMMLAIILSFFKEKHMPLMSTRLFIAFLITALCSLIFEWCAIFALKYFNWDNYLVRFIHQLFISSLVLTIFLLYMYVGIKNRGQQRYSICQLILRFIPIIISLGFIVFAPIEYKVGPNGVAYSTGLMVIPVYIMTIIYSLLTIYLVLNKKTFSLQAKTSISCGVLFWVAFAIIQFILPYYLFSSLGTLVMTIFLTFSVENTHDYIDFEVKDSLNHYAFDEILSELYAKGKDFYVINYVIESNNHDEIIETCNFINFEYLKYPTYIPHERVLSVIFTKKEFYNFKLKEVSQRLSSYKRNKINYFVSTISCPKYANTHYKFNQYIEYIAHNYDPKNVVNEFNDEDLKNKDFNILLEELLIKAVENKEFDIVYQPIYSTFDKKFKSAEALIRLQDNKTLGFISPEVFIPCAEKLGLISAIGDIVFDKVCNFISSYKLTSLGVDYIEVNISGIEATDLTLPSRFNETLKKYNLDPKVINIEITETASVEAGEKLDINMKSFRDAGYHFSMDDFGSGYSNFKKMAETKFELIKIDKSLIWPCFDIANDRREVSLNILKECIRIVHFIGSGIVAEGVETKEMLDFLVEQEVEYIQGYYFSKPLYQQDYIDFLKKNNKN